VVYPSSMTCRLQAGQSSSPAEGLVSLATCVGSWAVVRLLAGTTNAGRHLTFGWRCNAPAVGLRQTSRSLYVASVAGREELRADGPLLAFMPAACEVLAIPSPAAITITARSLKVLRFMRFALQVHENVALLAIKGVVTSGAFAPQGLCGRPIVDWGQPLLTTALSVIVRLHTAILT
jgi:hypothetical protein